MSGIGVAAWAWFVMPHGWLLAATLGLGWALIALASIDIKVFRLPDPLTLPLAAAGLLVAWFSPVEDLRTHCIGASVGYGVLAGLAWAYRRLRGRDGLGMGDAKLMAAAGAWLGWEPLPSVLLIACAAAFAWVGVRLLLQGRGTMSERIAFGAPLCLGIWIVWLYGPLGTPG